MKAFRGDSNEHRCSHRFAACKTLRLVFQDVDTSRGAGAGVNEASSRMKSEENILRLV